MARVMQDDRISHAAEILMPHMRTQDDCDARITEAFFLAEPRLHSGIALDGAPDTFTVLCVKRLLVFGCLNDRQRALARLLRVVRKLSSQHEQAHIDQLCACSTRTASTRRGLSSVARRSDTAALRLWSRFLPERSWVGEELDPNPAA